MRVIVLALCICVGMLAAGCDASPPPLVKPHPQVNVLVFTATWCGPCRRQHPEVIVLKAKGLTMHEYDIDKNPAMARRWEIRSVPTYVVREGRKELWRTNDVNDLWKLVK